MADKSSDAMNVIGRAIQALPWPGATPESSQLPAPPVHTIPVGTGESQQNIAIKSQDGLISLVVRDAPLTDVLGIIGRTQRINFVFASTTDTNVTVALERVSLSVALQSILTPAGYTWTVQNDVVYITSMGQGANIPPALQGRRLTVFELDYASAVDVDLAVKGLLSPVGQSFVTQSSPTDNRRTKEVVVVEDLPGYLGRISDYIAQVDQPPRQVMIQVHVLRVNLDENNRNGVNFDALANLSNGTLRFKTTGFANPSASQAFFVELDSPNLDGLVELLKTTTDAKTLASPRISAVNGQESRIQIGEQLGFRVTTTTETSTLESVDFLDLGVVLRVTPRISRDGHVLMRVKPEVSSGQVNPDTGLPEEETTEVETDVLLNDGFGMVIGGLIQEKDSNVQSKVPVLGDLQYVGALFQRREVIKSRSEIIIVLIPHVMPYHCNLAERDAHEVERAATPLTHGALRRVPRPSEPRLPDAFYQPLRLKDLPVATYPNTTYARDIRRLPPVDEPVGHETWPPGQHVPQQPFPQQGIPVETSPVPAESIPAPAPTNTGWNWPRPTGQPQRTPVSANVPPAYGEPSPPLYYR